MAKIVMLQLLVAGSFLLVALPIGCSVNFPSVLLHQLASNDSSIQLDWDTASWIGSIHGIAAIPSILMPALMQWRGRKLVFILACLVGIIGWIVAFTATSSTSILISESILGFCSQSTSTVGMLAISEMLSPQVRNVTMGLYMLSQALGVSLVVIVGSYLHWKSVTLVACAPFIVVTILVACMWPESPSWLAYKGDFENVVKAFTRLRGTGDVAQTELEELILAQKENFTRDNNKNNNLLKYLWQTMRSRDFYLPIIHIFILFESVYYSGTLAIMIYSSEIIQRITSTRDSVSFGNITMNIFIFVGCITSLVLNRYFKPKRVLLVGSLCSVIFLLMASGVSYFQTVGLVSNESYICLYLLFGFEFFFNTGSPTVVTLTTELMPVKHRGVGGPLYVIITCIMHTSLLKIFPYMLKYFNLWGSLLIFGVNGIISNTYIWKYVPETKGKTLQQLEDYYAYGDFNKHRKLDARTTLDELIPVRE